MEWKRKIFKSGGSLHVVIPKDIVDYLNLQEGEQITITEQSFIKVDDGDTQTTTEIPVHKNE